MRHPILTALAALLLALGLSGAANAGPFEDADAVQGGDKAGHRIVGAVLTRAVQNPSTV